MLVLRCPLICSQWFIKLLMHLNIREQFYHQALFFVSIHHNIIPLLLYTGITTSGCLQRNDSFYLLWTIFCLFQLLQLCSTPLALLPCLCYIFHSKTINFPYYLISKFPLQTHHLFLCKIYSDLIILFLYRTVFVFFQTRWCLVYPITTFRPFLSILHFFC